jgi:GR25 family glycosyltransferase involved in LPS biosynthesis
MKKNNNFNKYLYYLIYIILLIFLLYLIYILFKPQYNLVKHYPKNINQIYQTIKKENLLIDKIYCIALEKRLDYIKKTLINYYDLPKYKITFIKPYLKDKLNIDELIKNKMLYPNNNLSLGQIACYLSHYKCLNLFNKSNKEICLIFEDDIDQTNKNVIPKINTIIKNVPKNFDVIYLGRCLSKCYLDEKINEDLYKTKYSLCTHSMIISKKGCKKILKNLFPIKIPIDNLLGNLSYSGKLNSYASTKQIFEQKKEKNGKFKTSLDYSLDVKFPVCLSLAKEVSYFQYEFLR